MVGKTVGQEMNRLSRKTLEIAKSRKFEKLYFRIYFKRSLKYF